MDAIIDAFTWLVDEGNNLLWTYILIALLLGLGVYFTVRTHFVQVRSQ